MRSAPSQKRFVLFPRNRRGGVLVRLLTGSRLRNQSFWVSPPRSPLAATRIDRSRRGEANAAPGPDQLLDLRKSIFPILRGAETPTQRGYTWETWDAVFCGRSSSPRSLFKSYFPIKMKQKSINHASSTHQLGISGYWTFSILLNFNSAGKWNANQIEIPELRSLLFVSELAGRWATDLPD